MILTEGRGRCGEWLSEVGISTANYYWSEKEVTAPQLEQVGAVARMATCFCTGERAEAVVLLVAGPHDGNPTKQRHRFVAEVKEN